MFESLTHLIVEYGLTGLFATSLVGSTIFIPFATELAFPPLLAAGVSPYKILFASVVGSTLGVWVNYLLGYYGIHIIRKYLKKEETHKAKKIMDKYGWLGLLLIFILPLPLPTDPLTVLCGISEMNPLEFTIVVLVGKIVKYGVAVGLLSLIL
jgi:membrane protein YqaA with SNARE-associated domain